MVVCSEEFCKCFGVEGFVGNSFYGGFFRIVVLVLEWSGIIKVVFKVLGSFEFCF